MVAGENKRIAGLQRIPLQSKKKNKKKRIYLIEISDIHGFIKVLMWLSTIIGSV